MRKYLMFFLLLSFNCRADYLPEHLEILLARSSEYFEIYNDKTPAEIDDDFYDESEYILFGHIDQISGLNIVFSKEEIKTVKIRTVQNISTAFSEEQLRAIINVAHSPVLNKKTAARYFEVALEYKGKKLKDSAVPKKLKSK